MMALRSYLFVAWLYGWMAICGILYLPAILLPRIVTQRAIRLYAQIIRVGLKLICNIDTEIRGREHIPQGPFIYAGKHHCMLDIFIPFIVTSDPAIVLKRELLFYPFLGWYALKTKMIPIDRAGTSKTLKAIVAAARERVEKRRAVVIFPEGTRTAPYSEPAYQPAGISALNKALDLPIVPVATNAGLCWPARGTRRKPGKIIYEILPPIAAGLDRKALMPRLEGDLETASNRLLEEGAAVQKEKLG
ncbi:putative 1-acyl-sn-glycerol-3-phosphate acyltransferase [Hyphomonas polymorpha PS728]|uniref:Putative 1-acyl-sn-glycerol-3-phosphate acyltransferase n=1 Tax=Hyphomonas polymorpha PS728 TaxID=1280954 RepID=A0A062VAH6_9PROT|nr:lysophospholipid acyltransferase family protein [Hyphomonas polymorpha]KCZ97182.1 putative 1-acyl-sn-glycerol-3-phosphate acyltransferase [Hyphomonas polymorpha PS728]